MNTASFSSVCAAVLHDLLDSFELFRAAGHVIFAAHQVFQRVYLVALGRRVDIADGHWRANTAGNAVQKCAEVAHLPIVHHQELGVFIDRSVPIEEHLFSSLWLVVRHLSPALSQLARF